MVSLAPEVVDLVERGHIVRLDLIRFDLPGKTVGYHRGGRPYTYNGLVYYPNRWLQLGSMRSALGVGVTTRTITFANVPTPNPDDAVAALENYDYLNAPVIISHLAGDPETDEALGVLASSLYEIDRVQYSKSEMDEAGQRQLTINIELQPPGRSARGATHVRRSQEEQQFDNDATDTCLEYASVVATQEVKWGQRG